MIPAKSQQSIISLLLFTLLIISNLAAGDFGSLSHNQDSSSRLSGATAKAEQRSNAIGTIPIRTDLIQSYSRQVRVQQQIYILNKVSCNIGSTFHFDISEPSRITLEFADENNAAAITTLINNQSYGSGQSELPITA